eukprot:TRINITY_DN54938_c0_g1_i1.p1 TRINITY_DN54938_c0_g1~~TRINITY_DN54938_c0_g1_i1.p1  ORF type:complete len:520 (+),score=40.92 TRINITY_DN54938_c0_g1_i1:164-1561(+)
MDQILSKCGRIFNDSKGTAKTYELSAPVPHISYFLSHNWSVPRWKKFVALAVYSNMRDAFVLSWLTLAILTVFLATGLLPVSHFAWCRVLCMPVFFFHLCFASNIKALLGCKAPTVFLDKTCIHQEDPKAQRMGIAKLGAFIHKSNHMLVLYTDVYLQKLWTVYEIACFLTFMDVRDMTIIPVNQYLALSCGLAIIYFLQLMKPLVYRTVVPEFGAAVIAFFLYICGFCFVFLYRLGARDKDATRRLIDQFTVSKCMCACESDRPFVYGNICKLMNGAGFVQDCDEERALLAFEQLVRDELLPCFKRAIVAGLWSRYKVLVAGLFLILVPDFVDEYLRGPPYQWQTLVSVGKSRFFFCTLYGPGCLLSCSALVSRHIQLTGCAQFVYVLFVYTFVAFVPFALMSTLWWIWVYPRELESVTFLVLYVVFNLSCLAVMLCFIYQYSKKRPIIKGEDEAPMKADMDRE